MSFAAAHDRYLDPPEAPMCPDCGCDIVEQENPVCPECGYECSTEEDPDAAREREIDLKREMEEEEVDCW